jgi:hypothetical protein
MTPISSHVLSLLLVTLGASPIDYFRGPMVILWSFNPDLRQVIPSDFLQIYWPHPRSWGKSGTADGLSVFMQVHASSRQHTCSQRCWQEWRKLLYHKQRPNQNSFGRDEQLFSSSNYTYRYSMNSKSLPDLWKMLPIVGTRIGMGCNCRQPEGVIFLSSCFL